jgi:ADP-ribose pyrophosphatase
MNIHDKACVFTGVVFDVEQFDVETDAGSRHTYQVVRHPGGVAVLPLHADGTITLIRQERPAIATSLLEIPAGRLGDNESPEECGRRELREETGLLADSLHPLGIIHPSPGIFDEVIHLYAATGLSQHPPLPDDDEQIEPVRLPLAEALAMARDGRISDAKTIVALFRTGAHYR